MRIKNFKMFENNENNKQINDILLCIDKCDISELTNYLKNESNLKQTDKFGNNLLNMIINSPLSIQNKNRFVEILLDYDIDIDFSNKYGYNALILASQLPDVFDRYEPKSIPFLWKEGYDIKAITKKYEEPKKYTPTTTTYTYREKSIWNDIRSEYGAGEAKYVVNDVEKMLDEMDKEKASEVIVRDCEGKIVDLVPSKGTCKK